MFEISFFLFRSGDMKYGDDSYFTEGEETGKGATASGFTESYTEGDTSANEAQG